MNNKLPILDIQKIRKYENIKLEIFSMSLSEMKLTTSLIMLVYIAVMLSEALLSSIITMDLFLLIPFSIPVILISIKFANKKYGTGIIFYMVEDFKNSKKIKFDNINIIKNKKL
mgnify:CR=1 FL=1|jgi:hypothetical protein